MKDKINTYFAILLITIAGSGAALIITHVGTTNVIEKAFAGSEANYNMMLQQSIREKNNEIP